MSTALLHGFTGSTASWDGIRGVPIAIPGHAGAGPQHPRSWRATLARLADELPAPCAVAGYSLGGRLALGLALEYPMLVTRLILIGASFGIADEEERARRRAADESWALKLESEGIERFAEAWEAQEVLQIHSPVPSDRLARAREIRRSHDPEGLAWCLRTLGLGAMPSYRDKLELLAQPVVFVAGGEDAKFRAIGEELLQIVPETELVVVPGCGHNVVLERPDSVLAVI